MNYNIKKQGNALDSVSSVQAFMLKINYFTTKLHTRFICLNF